MKKRGLAALKEKDPEKFATIQQAGTDKARELNYGWTPERKKSHGKRMSQYWAERRNENHDNGQSA